MVSDLNGLKRQVFYAMLNLADRVFIHVRYSEAVIIEPRGFLPEEKEKGLVLVLNSQMNFEWSDSGITAKLAFSGTQQKCFIPADEILSIFSPELNAQFLAAPKKLEYPEIKADSVKKPKIHKDKKVIKVDFNKKE